MIANLEQTTIKKSIEKVPDYLIKEVIYGKPYYYKNYQAVLNNEKKLEEIMGSSRLQSFIITLLTVYFSNLFDKKYWVINSEPGLHMETKDNLSLDIAFFDKSSFPIEKIDNHYFEEVPDCVIEVDVSIDLTNAENYDYVFQKTQRLIDFGTSQVVWILTKSRKIMVAKPNEAWLTDNWDKEISILGQTFVLETLLKEKGLLK